MDHDLHRISGRTDTIIVGESPAIVRAVDLARRVAVRNLSMLLVGATGTGKELFAAEIHRWSGRPGLLVDINCAAVPRDLFEGALYGHRRGAFSGAVENVAGLVEQADNGTLFLDELCSMPLASQGKLLRVLDTGELRRVGETLKRCVRFRVVAAVQEDVGEKIASGVLRHDLIQRLAGAVIKLAPLCRRGGDAALLARHFATAGGWQLSSDAERVIAAHSWPGNVRELCLAVERAGLLSNKGMIDGPAIAESIDLGAMTLGVARAGVTSATEPAVSERDLILAHCAAHGWDAERAAQALGLGRTTFFKQLRMHGVRIREERSSIVRRAASPAGSPGNGNGVPDDGFDGEP